jgi:chitinase
MVIPRLFRSRSVVLLAALTTMAVSLVGTAGAAASTQRVLPSHVFSPYFQSYLPGDPAELAAVSGTRYLTMAFLQTHTPGSCEVLWNGDPATPVSQSTYGDSFAKIRARGGDVAVSFGGGDADGHGTDIADSCADAGQVAAAYENVITTYGITRIDLDVEGAALDNAAGVDRRNKAIHEVEAWAGREKRAVQFVYTLPTFPTTLAQNGLDLLTNAVANQATIDIVNVMTFDYYDDQPHEMAADTKTAAEGLVATLHKLYPAKSQARLWGMVGVTEMVGLDDYGSGGETGPAEIFTPADAAQVTAWAWLHGIGELSFWAAGRDNGSCPGVHGDACSGVAQAPWQYAHTMSLFTHGW